MEFGGWVQRGIGRKVRWGWEEIFGVGEGTHRQTIKILTGQEYTMSPKTMKALTIVPYYYIDTPATYI